MVKITLNKIRQFGPCVPSWELMLKHKKKTHGDDEPLSFETILDVNGLDDAIWCLSVLENNNLELYQLTVQYLKLIEPLITDFRSLNALLAMEQYSLTNNNENLKEAASAARKAALETERKGNDLDIKVTNLIATIIEWMSYIEPYKIVDNVIIWIKELGIKKSEIEEIFRNWVIINNL
jgi:hypothetical protein